MEFFWDRSFTFTTRDSKQRKLSKRSSAKEAKEVQRKFSAFFMYESGITDDSHSQWWILGEANETVASGPPFFLGAPPRKQHIQFWIYCRCLLRGRFGVKTFFFFLENALILREK